VSENDVPIFHSYVVIETHELKLYRGQIGVAGILKLEMVYHFSMSFWSVLPCICHLFGSFC
jgi:hypothetical protein